MASCRSDLAGTIKQLLAADEVARRYGFHPDRSGFIQCPFHKGDRHGSLKLYPGHKGWHCFGCGRGGSVIDFVMELFGITFVQAVVRINADFGLGLAPERPSPSHQSEVLRERHRLQREAAERRTRYFVLAKEHCYWLEASKVFAPTESGFIHPVYAEAVKRLEWLNYITDELMRIEEVERERTTGKHAASSAAG